MKNNKCNSSNNKWIYRKKIADKIVKPDMNLRDVEEIIIPAEKWEEILNELRPALEHFKTY